MRAVRYAFEEALASLWRGRQAGLLSTLTIAVALFVLGGFLAITANLERLGAEWSNSAELSIYLKDDTSAEQRQALETALAPGELVTGHEYISKVDALARFKQTFGDLGAAVDGVGGNPLPASLEVRLRPAPAASSSVDSLAVQLRAMPGVSDVRYDRQWLTRVASAISIIRGAGLSLGLVLAFAAALTVANVVRLALYARRDELEIMDLVGAPHAYVHGPFIMEGVLQGGFGALLALIALAAAYFAMQGRYLVPLASALNMSSIGFLPAVLCALMILGGMAVGCLGGVVAAWKR